MQKNILLIVLLTASQFVFSQNNANTPYSLFGLGVENKTATAGLTGLGNSGIAQSNPYEINIFNPANLGNMLSKTFLYEFGLNGTYSTLQTNNISETSNNGNISHIAIAFPVRNNLGISIGLLPYTKTGYNVDIESPVEGSLDTFTTRITGLGGLNKFYIAAGIQPLKNLTVGVDFSFLFGSIEQESLLYSDTFVSILDQNYYNGVKLKTGFQYKLPKINNIETTLGGTFELPTSLSGKQTRTSYKTTAAGSDITIEDAVENDLDNFELPKSFGVGLTTKFNNTITTNLDFRKLFWNDTNQQLNNERYTDESIYALGVEYLPNKNKYNYWSNVKYRFGMNYNTGFLKISNQQIDSYFVSVGLGLPMKKNSLNKFNISYSYGKEGTLENDLIQENFHKITLNLNFVGNWFSKAKID